MVVVELVVVIVVVLEVVVVVTVGEYEKVVDAFTEVESELPHVAASVYVPETQLEVPPRTNVAW